MPCFSYLCHVLYVTCQFKCMLYDNKYVVCYNIHVVALFIYAAPRFPFLLFNVLSPLIYVGSTQVYVASTKQILSCIKICQQFHFFHHQYSEKLSSPAVACGLNTHQDLIIIWYNNSQWCCLRESPQYIFCTVLKETKYTITKWSNRDYQLYCDAISADLLIQN